MCLTAMERSVRELVIYPQQQRLWCSDTGCRGRAGMCLTAMERSMRTLVIYPQQQRLWCSDTAVEEESRDGFNSNGEVYENACDLPPAAETVVQ